MKQRVIEYWSALASAPETDEAGALRKVLDPMDRKGVKNSYLDAYLKHYMRKHLSLCPEDILLEVGSGTGRLTEYMSPFVRKVFGVDIAEAFIDRCNANPGKSSNTVYLKTSEAKRLSSTGVNKMYVTWVLMYITDNAELINTLQVYRDLLPGLKEAVVLEQVMRESHQEVCVGPVECVYRSLEEYQDIFRKSGFRVKGYSVMVERYNAPLYKLLHIFCNLMPRKFGRFGGRLFYLDKRIMGRHQCRVDVINNNHATDILFRLETI